MREIKFRACKDGQMYFQEYCGGFSYFIKPSSTPKEEQDAYSLEDIFVLAARGGCVLQQYTGLNDKNGNLIYEGDIVSGEFYDTEYHHTETIKHEVVFNNGAYNIASSNWHKPTLEIIGNIFETPELLKQ